MYTGIAYKTIIYQTRRILRSSPNKLKSNGNVLGWQGAGFIKLDNLVTLSPRGSKLVDIFPKSSSLCTGHEVSRGVLYPGLTHPNCYPVQCLSVLFRVLIGSARKVAWFAADASYLPITTRSSSPSSTLRLLS